jgi:glycosyltransferase involved in cell wall biosynthesis
MATILVVTSAPPLVEGGHLVIARSLEHALREAGHQAGIVTTPSNRFGRQAAAYLANWLTDVGRTGAGDPVDQIITLRFPSYAVRHPRHVCWLNHTMREYYDRWGDFSATLSPEGRIKERVRRTLIRTADTWCFRHHVTRLFAQSRTIAERLRQWNQTPAEVLFPPPPPRAYRCAAYGDYLFAPSRLSPLKRMDLVVRALARPAASGVRVVIAGEGEDLPRLQTLVRELAVDDRVIFTGRLSEDDLLAHYAGCRGVVFVPRDEDYGFVTVEAFASAKAVITAADSGGAAELVRPGENSLRAAPAPAALAEAFVRLMDSPTDAERMGRQAAADVAPLTWPAVVRTLTAGVR